METLIDGIISVAFVLGLAAGGHLAIRKMFEVVRQEALLKTSQGLPRLGPFTHHLTYPSASQKRL